MELARHGANVVVNDLGAARGGAGTDSGPAVEVANEIQAAGGTAMAAYCSVASYDELGRMVAQCAETHDGVDIARMLRERMVWNMTAPKQAPIKADHTAHARSSQGPRSRRLE